MTVKNKKMPGKNTSHQWFKKCARDCVIKSPHSTSGCCAPKPMKERPAEVNIAKPASMDACVKMGFILFGKICFFII